MSNVASVLKSEISRLSKKVVRQHVAPIQSATRAQRKQLVALRRELLQLRRQVALLQRSAKKHQAPTESSGDARQFRFSTKGLQSLRKRLGLSAEEFGQLIQVSGKTVYTWESGSSPRSKHLPAIAELRNIGKREARARLEQLNGG